MGLLSRNISTDKRLPDSELEVMQVIWECSLPAKRAEVEERMKEIHPIAQTTLLTLLSRLTEKGFIKTEKQGRSSVYTPLITKEAYLAGQGNRFINQLCKGNLNVLACALVDSGLSDEDIEELRSLLEKKQL